MQDVRETDHVHLLGDTERWLVGAGSTSEREQRYCGKIFSRRKLGKGFHGDGESY